MEVNNTQSVHRSRHIDKAGAAQGSENRSEIRAEIVDIRRDAMTIKSPNGTLINGKLLTSATPIDARIGETHTFTVSRGEGGEIILEMQAKSQEVRQSSAIRDALISLGFTANAENTRIALVLYENQIPITRENMMRMTQGARLLGADALERVLFFLENDVPIAPRLTSAFDALLGGQFKINDQLKDIAEGLRNLPEAELGNRLADMLVRGEAAMTQNELAAKLARSAITAAPEQTPARILYAFTNPNLQESGAQRLAQILTEMLPSMREHVAEAAQARTDLTRISVENREQLSSWLAANTRGDGTDAQRFAQMLLETLSGAGANSAAKSAASTQAGIKIALAAMYAGDGAQLAKALEALGLSHGSGLAPAGDGAAGRSSGIDANAAQNAPGRDAIDTLVQKLSFSPENGRLADFLERFLNDTRANFELARQALTLSDTANTPAGARLMAHLAAVCDNLEFVSHIRNSFYTQIPLALGENSVGAELYVFRDKSRRNQAGGHTSALVAIDTASLGRFEAYVVKQGRTLSCQFRLENEDIRSHVASHLTELSDALKALDYRLDGVSYRESGESFTLLNKESQLEPQDDASLVSFINEFRRTSFDVRV